MSLAHAHNLGARVLASTWGHFQVICFIFSLMSGLMDESRLRTHTSLSSCARIHGFHLWPLTNHFVVRTVCDATHYALGGYDTLC